MRWFNLDQRTFFLLLVCICPRDKCVSFLFQSMKLIVSINET
ncbi:hypothetical protein HMPREF0973_01219 [Prevotella veroralis F0319]|uniref:Uncharacterized protein n=1 Tax=Prevotella veroralis F0319 TaxID=649761 RepID=C9MNN1_9BACT|nr:hypothetical protein HMPREF0973_01219 [Prevotella veroralis F0319]